jgi:hypothetical protein
MSAIVPIWHQNAVVDPQEVYVTIANSNLGNAATVKRAQGCLLGQLFGAREKLPASAFQN